MTEQRGDRYPGYDVLSKRDGLSWNDATRKAIDARLAVPRDPRFFTRDEFTTLTAICGRIVPQPNLRADVPLAAAVDAKMFEDKRDGFRQAVLPPQREAWRRGLAAFDAEARKAHGRGFAALSYDQQDALLKQAEQGALEDPAWGGMPSKAFFSQRVLHDIVSSYYAHPTAWSEIGFGGPASPRGYVRMALNRRDPWEAAEAPADASPAEAARARKENLRVR